MTTETEPAVQHGATAPQQTRGELQATPRAIPEEALRLSEDVTLPDGASIHIRALRPDDDERLRAFHAQLSTESIVFRFFRYFPELSQGEARRFTQIDYDRQLALVASRGTEADERILAVVRYCGLDAETAEVAFVVADAWQGRGVATYLFRRLAAYARRHGFRTLVAVTMASNARMLDFFRHCGFAEQVRRQAEEFEIRLDISSLPSEPPVADMRQTRVLVEH